MALSRRIKRYCPDFSKIERGLYLSAEFDDVRVYDLVTRTPNSGSVMEISAMHSLCHLFESYIISSEYSSKVILFAPSGGATGFSLVVRSLDGSAVIKLLRSAFQYIRDFDSELPKENACECSNAKEHDMDSAKKEATLYLPLLNRWDSKMTIYKND